MMRSELAHRAGPAMLVHHVPAAAGHFILSRQIDELRSTAQYALRGRAARTLFKRAEMSVVLVVLARGSAMTEHRVDRPVSIHTVEGWVTVHAPGESVEHVAGGLQLLDPSVVHNVEALADSALLLSIPWPDC
ncbi:MAG: hypothetical protein IT377_25770 [Polyangiaceae bacterium]|nr:hypothetical protein [Polyangiaceae bacterium]